MSEIESNATPAPPALVAAEDAMMGPPTRPTLYTVLPQALRVGVLSRGDVAEVTRGAHAAGLSDADLQSLQLAAVIAKGESADGRTVEMRRARMNSALASRHGERAGDQVKKAQRVVEPLRASKPLAALIDLAMDNPSFVTRMAARADYTARKASRKGG